MKSTSKSELTKILVILSALMMSGISGCVAQETFQPKEDIHREAEYDRTPEEKAYKYLCQIMDKYHTTFEVYSDKDAGGNHFVPSGWMGDSGDMTFEAGCFTNPHSGATCIRINYAAAGSRGQNWAGIYWQFPENNWGEARGYNLTGATRLTFWARGAKGGERIEFKVGGVNRPPYHDSDKPFQGSFGPVTTGAITLSRSWQEYHIDLRGRDLANVIGGFCWVTNIHRNPRGCVFYLDDIYFDNEHLGEPRFLVSYEMEADSSDKYLRNTAFLYDNALVMLAFLARGNEEDSLRAKIIADALLYALDHDRFFTDGRLRNAYQAGDLADSLTGEARLPGWWDEEDTTWFEDKYQVSTHAGNLAWAVIALTQFYEAGGGMEYLNAAERLADWIFRNCYDSSGLGGYMGGYEGWGPDAGNPEGGQTKLIWKSTEHNIDVWCAFMKLYHLTGAASWKEKAVPAKRFVEAMWNESEGHFWTGTKRSRPDDKDMINREVLPLDVNTWSLMALGNTQKYGMAADWARKSCYVERCPQGCAFKGFDFNDDKDGVWFEGTAQMCVAHQILGDTQASQELLGELRNAQTRARNADGNGVVAACHDGLTTGFEWVYNNRRHIAATAWFIFAEREFNPYWGISTKEAIPYEDIH